MKIAWFSPMAPDRSDVANFTQRLTAELCAHHEVRFFTERAEGFYEPAADTSYPAPLGQTPTELIRSLNEAEVPIYNIGNHPAHFSRTWFLGQLKPGIVILHDLKLHHFYEGIYRLQMEDMPGYLAPLWEHYGAKGYEAGLAYWREQVSVEYMAQHFPMTPWAIQNALAVVVHTSHALETIRRFTRTPAQMIPLAFAPRPDERPARLPGQIARLVLFGHLHVNRRVVEFLTALAEMPERGRFEVHLVGTIFNQREVETAVETLGLQGQVRLHGYVSDEELAAALDASDLAVNLRYPSMGEASGSQLRIWDHALPSLVTKVEGYAELPSDTVFFVDPENEQADIQAHLRHFLERPEDFRRAGERGRGYLRERHLPSMYVARLDEILARCAEWRSRHNQLGLAERVGTLSAPWSNTISASERERFYADRISELG